MLWRIVADSTLPAGLPTALLIEEMCRAKESPGEGAAAPDSPSAWRADFICDQNGDVTFAHTRTMVSVEPAKGLPAIFTVVKTVATVAIATTEFANSTAAAASDAAKNLADAAGQAATWGAETASNVTSRLKRTVANEEGNAGLRSEAERLSEVLEAYKAQMRTNHYFDRLKVMFAVGIAIAAADGDISEHEQSDIRDFVAGGAHALLPPDVQDALQRWLAAPPSIEEAFALACQCGEESMPLFDAVIEVAINADEEVHPAELAFKEQWKEMRDGVFA